MLQFFRINDPYRLIFVFLILVSVRVIWVAVGLPLSLPELKWLLVGQRLGDGFTMYQELFDSTGPLAVMVYKWLDILFGQNRWPHILLSTLVIILQAGIFNSTLLRNKAYDENHYVAAFLYVVVMSSTGDFLALSPQLMALTFVLLSLNQIFRRIDNVVTDELFLISGLYLGTASLFYLPASVFFFVFLLSFVFFSSAVLRRLLLLIYGALIPVVLVWCYFFWFNAADDFLFDFFVAGLIKPKVFYINYVLLLKVGGLLVAAALLGVSVFVTQRFTNFQQKMQQVMILFFLGGIMVTAITREVSTADLVFLVPSVTFFLVYYLLGLQKRIWKALMPYLIVVALLAYPFWWLHHPELEDLRVDEELPHEESSRIMGIGLDLRQYYGQELAGPFLDPFIGKQKLSGLDYYDEASELYKALDHSHPEVIVDEWGVMDRIFYRFPTLAKRYRPVGEGQYVQVSN
ncbi:DUF6427 family protein [Marinoscillum furvescens]|uniref:Dolichyl-phosphate-mannose-protein mannosyltransferase n=1 Tax=Marinoscillum furvescens DSM 4134 TaxID=1122208 RepID=A0A3D9L684_MARFU|nr:DUF6427 family protein [Marinoscillum furvescens]REE00400.1 hypothetical protein C7460_10521 [Marinoscillum furvescens DSM 4134]